MHNKKRQNKKKYKKINLLYANPQGILGKIPSLISTAKATDAHIIGLAETKLGRVTPDTPGYTWKNKPRASNGGGVALLVREDVKHLVKEVSELEDQNQEIIWIELKNGRQINIHRRILWTAREV